MDKKKSFLNISLGVFFKIAVLFFTVYCKRCLIRTLGNDANGVLSLFTSVVGVLSVAELGVGGAIVFSMYAPIIRKDTDAVAALYYLYRRWYALIAVCILAGGLAFMPFLPRLASGYRLKENLYLAFLIQLLCTVFTYFYSDRVSLINAHKDNYITATLSSSALIIRASIQILLLFLVPSFYLYLLVGFLVEIFQYIFLYRYTRKHYGEILSEKRKTCKVDENSRRIINRNIRAIFMHKIGHTFVNTIDSLIISSHFGVFTLGLYTNYTLIVNALTGVIGMVFSQITSVIGHAYYQTDIDEFLKDFRIIYLANYWVASFAYLGFYGCASPFVSVVFGEDLLMEKSVVVVICLNAFIIYMRSAAQTFKDSTGLFYYDRYKALAEGAVNFTLSLWFARLIGVTGVIVATILTSLFIGHIVEPYVLLKRTFHRKPWRYYLTNYTLIGFFALTLWIYDKLTLETGGFITRFLVNGILAFAFSLPALALVTVYAKRAFGVTPIKIWRSAKRRLFRTR